MRSGSGPPGNSTVLSGNSGISALAASALRDMRYASGGLESGLAVLEQLAVQAAEPAVAHDQRVIAGTQGLRELGSHRVDLRNGVAARAERGYERGRIPAEIGRREEPHLVRQRERGTERVAMHAHLHRVRAGFEHRDDALLADAATQPVQSSVNGGRVMREVIVDADAIDLAAQLHAARNAREGLE